MSEESNHIPFHGKYSMVKHYVFYKIRNLAMKEFEVISFFSDPGDVAVQLFSFVLTDENSQLTFGYCRYTPRTNTVICLLR